MTDQFAALVALSQSPGKTRDDILADFYNEWKNDFLVNSDFCIDLALFLF